MCNTTLPISSAVTRAAIKTKNNELAAQMDFSSSDLMTEAMCLRPALPEHLRQGERECGGWPITDLPMPVMTGLKAAIAAYSLLISKPRDARATGKTTTGQLGPNLMPWTKP